MLFDINVETNSLTAEDKAMLERLLGPVTHALIEAMKPELAAFRDQIEQANAARDQKAKDYETVNERRIVIENENATLIADKSRLEQDIVKLIAERDAANASAAKWESEALELVKTTDETLAKLRKERDEARDQRDMLGQRLGTVATRIHDLQLLLGN